jgi:hypothetical protein
LKINQRSKIHFVTILLFGISTFLLFSQFQQNETNVKTQIENGNKEFTELKHPFLNEINIYFTCTETQSGEIKIGSEYNLENYTSIDIETLPCNVLTKIDFDEPQLAEYISLQSDSLSSIEVNYEAQNSREVSNLRKILLISSILIFLTQLKIGRVKFTIGKNINRYLLYFVPILICSIIHFAYVIPNWDDGWQLAIIRNWDDFGTANSLWDRYNGIFGNWLHLSLNELLSNTSNQFMIRSTPLIIWWIQYFILVKFIEKYSPNMYHRETKFVLSAIYCFIVLSVGSSLRFESIIGLFNVIGLHFFYNYLKERNINSLIGLLLISALSITTGLAGLTTLIFPTLIIVKEFKRIKSHKIIYGQLILNSILLTVCLFLFNSNFRLFKRDLTETRLVTVYSHNFGVIDEWMRYFGHDGIFNYYNFSLKIIAIIILLAFYMSIRKLFQKTKHDINLNLILILMLLLLSLTPSKWGWYILPIIPIASVVVLNSISGSKVNSRLLLFSISIYTIIELYNGKFWNSNPAINSQVINSIKNDNSINSRFYLTLLVIIFALICLLYFFIESFKPFILTSVLFAIIFVQISGIIGFPPFNQSVDQNSASFSWRNNSLNSCSFIDKQKFTKIGNRIDETNIQFQNVIFFPLDDDQFSKTGVKRLTFSEKNLNDMIIKIKNNEKSLLLSFAVRGSEIGGMKVKTIYNEGNERYEKEISFLKSISDSSTWQILEPFEVKSGDFEIVFSRDEAITDVQITEPFEVEKINLLTYILKNKQYFHLGPQELFLGSCLESPQFSNESWNRPDMVIGNANTLRNIFNGKDVLRVINNCWVPLDEARIDDCLVEWHFNDKN